MSDELIDPGYNYDSKISRRTFGLGAAAVVTSSAFAADKKVVQRDVDVPMAQGVADCALFYPEGKGSWPAVLIWTDIFGLRPAFRDMGARLATQGYVVLVPNPFYRTRRAPVMDASFDFGKPEDRAKMGPITALLTQDAIFSDSKAFLAYLDAQPQTNKKAKAGVQGYCMGGPLTYRTAAIVPGRIGAAATFHGGGLVSDKPDSPHLLIPQMKATVYSAVADNDDKRDPTAKDTLKASFAAAKLLAKIEVYTGCNHGWSVKGGATYNEEGAERAWGELTALYKKALV